VIRIVAVGVICLAGVGVVTPLGRKDESAIVVDMALTYPVVTGNKSDRLPIYKEAIAPEPALEVDTPPAPTPQTVAAPQPSKSKTDRTQPEIIPRHWHDPATSKYRIHKRIADDAKRSQAPPIDKPKQISELKDCSPDGLAPLLRKLNLQPRCD